MSGARTCPKCSSAMAEGFVIDRGNNDLRRVPEWVEGPPERGFFGLKLKGKLKLAVHTWRCKRCGLLESFAGEA